MHFRLEHFKFDFWFLLYDKILTFLRGAQPDLADSVPDIELLEWLIFQVSCSRTPVFGFYSDFTQNCRLEDRPSFWCIDQTVALNKIKKFIHTQRHEIMQE